jgi:prephenate dehydrogenase
MLDARGVEATGWAHSDQTAEAARAEGLAVTTELREAVTGAGLVVLAVPLEAMRETAAALADCIDATDDAMVIDVGSVKAPVRAAVEAAGLGDRFVGAHPMAGNERSGFDASSAMLLDGATWAVTSIRADREVALGGRCAFPAERSAFDGARACSIRAVTGAPEPPRVISWGSPTASARSARVVAFIEETLGGIVIELTDDEHDAAVALVSQVPHVAATQLLNAAARSPLRDVALALAAGSFRDGTRVAHTDPERTRAMVEANASHVVPLLREAARDLLDLAERLEAGGSTEEFFHQADPLRN